MLGDPLVGPHRPHRCEGRRFPGLSPGVSSPVPRRLGGHRHPSRVRVLLSADPLTGAPAHQQSTGDQLV
ncbi:LEPR-XLL domain-containing protein [Streptomyces albus subsp. chlorinus]|nr:LEPR-XLL domain-containing protein [Streptomyces albus subsp. chlorinus]